MQLVKPQWRFVGTNGLGEDGAASGFFCAYGLAIQTIESGGARCRDALLGDGTARLGHSGDADGLESGLWWDPASGRGLAYFTTEVAPDAPTGRTAFTRAEESLVERAR